MENTNIPDLSKGYPIDGLRDGGMVQVKVGDDDVILARHGDEFFAVGANCSHYHGPLAKGLIVGEELRCPLHHACFSLRTGMALRAPAFDAIPRWRWNAWATVYLYAKSYRRWRSTLKLTHRSPQLSAGSRDYWRGCCWFRSGGHAKAQRL